MLDAKWNHMELDKETACHFWACFARAEFALKASHYAAARPGGTVAADWDRFGRDIATTVEANLSTQLAEAMEYLSTRPPKRQIIHDGRAIFESQATPSTKPTAVERALDYSRRVRNNLFHGGKYFESDESNRDRRLVEAVLVVLDACLRVVPAVWVAYEYGDG